MSIFQFAGVTPKDDEEEKTLGPAPIPSAKPAPVTPVQSNITGTQVSAKQSIYGLTATLENNAERRGYLTNEDVLNDNTKIDAIRLYMIHRKGDHYKEADKEELFDDFVDHMRWMETNEVNTFGEARVVSDLAESEKPIYGTAYTIYDQLGSALSAGGIGEFADAAANYTGAVLTSPSTYIGGFIGRALSKPVTKGTTFALRKALGKEVVETTVDTAAKATIKQAAKVAEKKAIPIVGKAAAKKTRQEMVTAALLGTAFDGSIAYAQDVRRQKNRIEVGVQEELDYTSAVTNSLFGIVGGAFSYFPEAMRGTIKVTDAGKKIELAKKLRAKEARKKAAKKVEEVIKKLATDWDTIAKEGQALDAKKYIRENTIDWFFDVENENSFVRILSDLGADLGADDKTFSHKMVEYVRGFPPAQKAAITRSLKPFNIHFGELLEIFAGAMKEGGESLSKASKASRFFEDFKNATVAKKRIVDGVIMGEEEAKAALKEGKEAPHPQTVKYVTSVWKRLLISHPATTMLNIKGWGWAASARAMSELIYGSYLGANGLVSKMLGRESADRTLAKSAAMFKSNWLMLRSIADPYTTYEGFSALLENAPKKHREESLSSFFGGVGDERPEMFGINPQNKAVKGTEATIDLAAKIALVRAQDLYTKSFSGIKELDKLSRINLGKGIEELLAEGKTHLITDEMWDKTVKTLLEDTFSVNYTRGPKVVNKLAKAMEDLSNTPGLGFIFPFGRFINNTVSFTFQYSPLAFLPLARFQKGVDFEERLMKAIVGTSAIVMLTSREEEKQKQGLQWNEELTSTGDIKDVGGIFPLSLYNLFGRLILDAKSGQGVPLSLKDELIKQIGPLGALNDATSSNPITDMIRELSQASESQDADIMNLAGMVGEMIAGTVSGIAAGFTRPLDPYNDITGMALDNLGIVDNAAIDRKQAEGMDKVLQNFSRYTDNFFSLLLGKDTGKGLLYGEPKNSATERDAIKDANPMSRIFGSPIKQRQDSIDIVLGMTDMAPFRMDSFTTGNPEYDDFINDTIFPVLERKAQAMLEGDFFASRPVSVKREMVSKMLTEARKEVLDGLENGNLGGYEGLLRNAQRKFVAANPQAYRAEAKKALGIDKKDKDLTFDEIDLLESWIEINKELDDYAVESY